MGKRFFQKKKSLRTPPSGMGRDDIATRAASVPERPWSVFWTSPLGGCCRRWWYVTTPILLIFTAAMAMNRHGRIDKKQTKVS